MRAINLLSLLLLGAAAQAQTDTTFAERLGYPKGAKVIILHVDDAGMSYDSNIGAFKALEEGVASSVSVMMPCPWVPHFVQWLKQHPRVDAGLHLTLTSEWDNYKWGPVSGRPAVPGLVDTLTGGMYATVAAVDKSAKPEEVGREIRAQIQKARQMGFEPTHLDTHMGTVYANPAFTMQYITAGIEHKIPVMVPGGHNTIVSRDMPEKADALKQAKMIGQMLWKSGLPVLDDLHNNSYGWKIPESAKKSDKALQDFGTQQYITAMEECKPGLTMIIMHCTQPTEVFPHISDSGPTRKADLLAMLDPRLKNYIREKGIILTTWRELMERRSRIK
ncbi:polysaccharide deacetylase family protein [Flavihumibacter rivuli]|uniref:polysaccharide deacetylase family protein n=1 Tax=Flavihumibacter rivuli TaxID=2838156 RepID=UPI001BDEE849|nr:polysaccharide deacetylase family protein [Flavihumibacter rivuli]ULQ55699.1 polysaccharide deacetylase family protein [Flavihumibacter rivuli]